MIILVIGIFTTSIFANQVDAKHTHTTNSDSIGGSSLSPAHQPQPSPSLSRGSSSSSSHISAITMRGSNNITSFVEECFTNNTGSALNITVNNASEIINHCFYQYKLEHINMVAHCPTAAVNPLGLGTLLAPGQLVVTSVKHLPLKHSAAYNIGYKLGAADGKTGGAGLPDGLGACNSQTAFNSTVTTNQCLAGYFAAWNKYCTTSSF